MRMPAAIDACNPQSPSASAAHKRSMTTPPLPTLLLQAQSRDGSGLQLPLAEAWAIAMTWCRELKGYVRLITEHQEQVATIVDSYAWVRFIVNFQDRRSVSIARAAAVSWLHLSSCPGYEGHVNVLFWRCVFNEYHMDVERYHADGRRSRNPHDEQNISDAVGFFDQLGHTFPRFMVETGDLEVDTSVAAGIRLFCGMPSEVLDYSVQAMLQQVLERLASVVDTVKCQRRVDVCLSQLDSQGFAEPTNRGYNVVTSLGYALRQLLRCINHSQTHANASVPRFHLEAFLFAGHLVIFKDHDAQLLYELMQQESFHFRYLRWFTVDTPAAVSAKVVASLLAQEGHAIRAKTSTIELSAYNNSAFTAFASALPSARSAHTIYLTSRHRRDEDFDRHDLPWLAYAMFHPDAAQSSWRALKMKYVEPTAKSVAVLLAMARGNNLHALLHGAEPTCDAYYRGRLAADANVLVAPPDGASILVSAAALSTSWVEVCGSLPWFATARVPVIVPGYGLGYVRAYELLDVEARRPSQPQLTGFTLLSRSNYLRDDAVQIVQFLQPFASKLQYLDVQDYCQWDAASLRLLVAQCPSLVTLAIGHDRKLWNEPSVVEELAVPHLKQLLLRVESVGLERTVALDYLPALLQLEALCIRSTQKQWPPSAIAAVLTRARQLRLFLWEDGLRLASLGMCPIDYSLTVQRSEQRLSQAQFVDDTHLYTDAKMEPRAITAMLSVVAHYQTVDPKCSLARVGSDVLVNLLPFVSTRKPRVIVIELEWAEKMKLERAWRDRPQ